MELKIILNQDDIEKIIKEKLEELGYEVIETKETFYGMYKGKKYVVEDTITMQNKFNSNLDLDKSVTKFSSELNIKSGEIIAATEYGYKKGIVDFINYIKEVKLTYNFTAEDLINIAKEQFKIEYIPPVAVEADNIYTDSNGKKYKIDEEGWIK